MLSVTPFTWNMQKLGLHKCEDIKFVSGSTESTVWAAKKKKRIDNWLDGDFANSS